MNRPAVLLALPLLLILAGCATQAHTSEDAYLVVAHKTISAETVPTDAKLKQLGRNMCIDLEEYGASGYGKDLSGLESVLGIPPAASRAYLRASVQHYCPQFNSLLR